MRVSSRGRRTAWVVGAAVLAVLAALVGTRASMSWSDLASTLSFGATDDLGAQRLAPEVVGPLETIQGGLGDLVQEVSTLSVELEQARREQQAAHVHAEQLEHSLRTAESESRHLREALMSMRGRNAALAAQLVETHAAQDETEAELTTLQSAHKALADELKGLKLLNQSAIALDSTAILAIEARIQEMIAAVDRRTGATVTAVATVED